MLAELSYEFGLIGIDELQERIEVARWLASKDASFCDPRIPLANAEGGDDNKETESKILEVTVSDKPENQDWLKFLFDGKWYFTKSDPDPYPSTPHGHLNSPDRVWPKLNPYTGRAFSYKHQEDLSLRLSKCKMQQLWRDQKFRSFCRDHILWYLEEFPHHAFPVRASLRLPKW